MFLIRIKPYSGEALLSFIYRYASANQISILVFWSYVKSENLLYSKMSTLNMLEMIPTSILNLELFSQATDISKDELLSMTYHYVQFKFSHSEEVTQSRIMKETIRGILYFCPQCLDEQNYIRLKWKIKGMDICLKHNTPLSTACPSCNQQIPLKIYQYDSQCPICQDCLCSGKKAKHSDLATVRQQQWLSDQWDTLFQISKRKYSPMDIAQKLIWFLNYQNIYLDMRELRIFCSDHQIDLQYLLQFARGTLQKKRSIHVFQLLKILDVCQIDVACIFKVKVPLEFIEKNLMGHSCPIAIECRAPWCSSYKKSESLKNKGTQYKRLKNGHVQKKYLFCTDCGCSYYLDVSGIQREHDFFIQAFPYIHANVTPIELASLLKLPLQTCYRIIAYFKTRLPLFTCEIESELLKNIQDALQNNMAFSQIQTWNCWQSFNQFFIYRYHIDVLRTKELCKRKNKSRINFDLKWKELLHIISYLKELDDTITAKKVAKMLRISSNTFRHWKIGYYYLIEQKNIQKEERLQIRIDYFYDQIDLYIKDSQKEKIYTKDIYAYLNIKQSFLLSLAPRITHYITEKTKMYNKSKIYQK